MNRYATLDALIRPGIHWLEQNLTPLFALAIRLHVAEVFFRSGLTKLRDWDVTLMLFANDYRVPLLPTEMAAVFGTAGELVLPILLVAGLFGRFGAAGLFVVNLVAVISYPDLSELGRADHVLWGALLLVTVFYGPGRWSLDAWLQRKLSAGAAPVGQSGVA